MAPRGPPQLQTRLGYSGPYGRDRPLRQRLARGPQAGDESVSRVRWSARRLAGERKAAFSSAWSMLAEGLGRPVQGRDSRGVSKDRRVHPNHSWRVGENRRQSCLVRPRLKRLRIRSYVDATRYLTEISSEFPLRWAEGTHFRREHGWLASGRIRTVDSVRTKLPRFRPNPACSGLQTVPCRPRFRVCASL
jgi:hypothetical protein